MNVLEFEAYLDIFLFCLGKDSVDKVGVEYVIHIKYICV